MSAAAPTEPPPRRRGLPRAFVALCVAIGVVVGAYCVLLLLSIASASTERRTRTFPASERLAVAAGSGDVRVVGERRADIRVDMLIHRGMWRGAWQPEVRMRRDGRALRLASDCSAWASIGVSECGASFTVHVPRGTRVLVDVSSGDVRIAGIARAVTAASSSGDVHAVDVAGPLRLRAGSGDVHVEGYRGRVVRVRTGSGDVDVRAVRAPSSLFAEAGSGDVHVAVPDLAYRVAVDSGSGDRHVGVPQDPDARRSIVARAGSGNVTVVRLADED